MPFVKCAVDGCNTRLQPILKVDPRDRDTWAYPECDVCHRPACDRHCSQIEGRVVCDRCRREAEAQRTPLPLLDGGVGPLPER